MTRNTDGGFRKVLILLLYHIFTKHCNCQHYDTDRYHSTTANHHDHELPASSYNAFPHQADYSASPWRRAQLSASHDDEDDDADIYDSINYDKHNIVNILSAGDHGTVNQIGPLQFFQDNVIVDPPEGEDKSYSTGTVGELKDKLSLAAFLAKYAGDRREGLRTFNEKPITDRNRGKYGDVADTAVYSGPGELDAAARMTTDDHVDDVSISRPSDWNENVDLGNPFPGDSVQPTLIDERPIPMEVMPNHMDGRPIIPAEVDPMPMEVQPMPMEERPMPMEVQPMPMEVHPMPMEEQSMPMEVRPMPKELLVNKIPIPKNHEGHKPDHRFASAFTQKLDDFINHEDSRSKLKSQINLRTNEDTGTYNKHNHETILDRNDVTEEIEVLLQNILYAIKTYIFRYRQNDGTLLSPDYSQHRRRQSQMPKTTDNLQKTADLFNNALSDKDIVDTRTGASEDIPDTLPPRNRRLGDKKIEHRHQDAHDNQDYETNGDVYTEPPPIQTDKTDRIQRLRSGHGASNFLDREDLRFPEKYHAGILISIIHRYKPFQGKYETLMQRFYTYNKFLEQLSIKVPRPELRQTWTVLKSLISLIRDVTHFKIQLLIKARSYPSYLQDSVMQINDMITEITRFNFKTFQKTPPDESTCLGTVCITRVKQKLSRHQMYELYEPLARLRRRRYAEIDPPRSSYMYHATPRRAGMEFGPLPPYTRGPLADWMMRKSIGRSGMYDTVQPRIHLGGKRHLMDQYEPIFLLDDQYNPDYVLYSDFTKKLESLANHHQQEVPDSFQSEDELDAIDSIDWLMPKRTGRGIGIYDTVQPRMHIGGKRHLMDQYEPIFLVDDQYDSDYVLYSDFTKKLESLANHHHVPDSLQSENKLSEIDSIDWMMPKRIGQGTGIYDTVQPRMHLGGKRHPVDQFVPIFLVDDQYDPNYVLYSDFTKRLESLANNNQQNVHNSLQAKKKLSAIDSINWMMPKHTGRDAVRGTGIYDTSLPRTHLGGKRHMMDQYVPIFIVDDPYDPNYVQYSDFMKKLELLANHHQQNVPNSFQSENELSPIDSIDSLNSEPLEPRLNPYHTDDDDPRRWNYETAFPDRVHRLGGRLPEVHNRKTGIQRPLFQVGRGGRPSGLDRYDELLPGLASYGAVAHKNIWPGRYYFKETREKKPVRSTYENYSPKFNNYGAVATTTKNYHTPRRVWSRYQNLEGSQRHTNNDKAGISAIESKRPVFVQKDTEDQMDKSAKGKQKDSFGKFMSALENYGLGTGSIQNPFKRHGKELQSVDNHANKDKFVSVFPILDRNGATRLEQGHVNDRYNLDLPDYQLWNREPMDRSKTSVENGQFASENENVNAGNFDDSKYYSNGFGRKSKDNYKSELPTLEQYDRMISNKGRRQPQRPNPNWYRKLGNNYETVMSNHAGKPPISQLDSYFGQGEGVRELAYHSPPSSGSMQHGRPGSLDRYQKNRPRNHWDRIGEKGLINYFPSQSDNAWPRGSVPHGIRRRKGSVLRERMDPETFLAQQQERLQGAERSPNVPEPGPGSKEDEEAVTDVPPTQTPDVDDLLRRE